MTGCRMKIKLSLLVIPFFLLGCATAGSRIKATAPNTEAVEADGTAPVVNGDLKGAKDAALNDAMKNALGLVVGVYVSQEALVSKSMLIEDNILSQTGGYIERYAVLGEKQENGFYNVRIKALVRKEDLAAKIEAMAFEPAKFGNPLVRIALDEFVDGQPAAGSAAAGELKSAFTAAGFTVSDDGAPDILVTGKAESGFNTDRGLAGLVSYRATLTLSASQPGTGHEIASLNETVGGIDANREAAGHAALANAGRRAGNDLPDKVLRYLKERSAIRLTVTDVENMNRLSDVTRAVRALVEVRDCRVRSFSGSVAAFDLDLARGSSSDVAKRLEQLDSVKLKVTETRAYDIRAGLVK